MIETHKVPHLGLGLQPSRRSFEKIETKKRGGRDLKRSEDNIEGRERCTLRVYGDETERLKMLRQRYFFLSSSETPECYTSYTNSS